MIIIIWEYFDVAVCCSQQFHNEPCTATHWKSQWPTFATTESLFPVDYAAIVYSWWHSTVLPDLMQHVPYVAQVATIVPTLDCGTVVKKDCKCLWAVQHISSKREAGVTGSIRWHSSAYNRSKAETRNPNELLQYCGDMLLDKCVHDNHLLVIK